MIIKNKYATYVGHQFLGKAYTVVQNWTDPDAPSATAVHAAVTLTTAVQSVSTSITNPDFPRVVSITGHKAGGSLTGNVTVSGTNIRGEAITDTIALSDDTTVDGVKAFKTITSISLPVKVTTGDTVSIGISDKLGLQSIPISTTVISEDSGNAADTGGAILTRDADEIEKCLYDPVTQCDASTDKTVVYISNEMPTRVGGYTE